MIENLPFYIATMWTSSIDRAFQNCDAPVSKYPCIRLVAGVSLSAGTDVNRKRCWHLEVAMRIDAA